MYKSMASAFGVGVMMLGGVVSCVPTTPDATVLEAIPPRPTGSGVLATTQTSFRSAEVKSEQGTWKVKLFEKDEFSITTPGGKKYPLNEKWYPEEGGADAAFVKGYQRGDDTWIVLEGSSDFVTQETRFLFHGQDLRSVVMYSLPGLGHGPEYPGKKVKVEDRIKREIFAAH